MNTLLVSIRAKPTNNNPFKYCLNNTILFEWNLLGSRVNVNLTIALCWSERYILSVLRLLRFYLFGFVYFPSPANKSIWCNRVQVLLFSIISLMFHAVIDLSVHVETRRNSNGGRKEKLLNFIVEDSMCIRCALIYLSFVTLTRLTSINWRHFWAGTWPLQ